MRFLNETNRNNSNKTRYYLGKVETVDENYIVTFSIPKILENLTKYPTAYPKCTDHVREVKEGDSILVEQLDMSVQMFSYIPNTNNSETGLFFGDVKVDITDGKTVNIETATSKINVDGENDNILITTSGGERIELDGQSKKFFIGNDMYSLNQWVKDLDNALKNLTINLTLISGGPGSPVTGSVDIGQMQMSSVVSSNSWYTSAILPYMKQIEQILK